MRTPAFKKDVLARRRTVKGWAFRDLTDKEEQEITDFLDGGPTPPGYENMYNTCREQLGLEPIVEEGLAGRIKEVIRKIKNNLPDNEDEDIYMAGQVDAYENVLSMIEEAE